jgi:3-hydroxybutyryl-CoA dehydrogenase
MKDATYENVAVVGGGLIGVGIAHQFAALGFPVAVFNRGAVSSRRARERLQSAVQRYVSAGLMSPQAAERCRQDIVWRTDLAATVAEADAVLEAVVEDVEVKQRLLARLDALCPPRVILATTTSGLSITALAAEVREPARVIGAHHFNPPPLLPGVEVVAGEHTSEETIRRTMTLLRRAGKEPVLVKDVPGFVVGRLSTALRREAWSIVQEGIAAAETVDAIWRATLGRAYAAQGPLEISDSSGIDVLLRVHSYIEPELTPSSTPSAMVARMVDSGQVGHKSGEGFYSWTPQRLEALYGRVERVLGAIDRAMRAGAESEDAEP